ncbi:MAG: cytochrome c oxidase subunit 3 [Pseudomonadaceae bacterium]|nr:cytochrome c oxidase subunit 3 [Pseudomonadaceae bacterium]
MSNSNDQSVYYVPHDGWYPVVLAAGLFFMVFGLGDALNAMKSGGDPGWVMSALGFSLFAVVLYFWFAKVIAENHAGLNNAQVKRSYVWGMGWFIFSEVMFFAAFFGALFYTRVLVVSWLGGDGGKAMTGDYLWPEFENTWPVMDNPDNAVFTPPEQSIQLKSFGSLFTYLPFWNTVILVASSFTVHWAHSAIKKGNRSGLVSWLALTVALGFLFVFLQGYEYWELYTHYGLTLDSGIYGSTFFILTGFHGFHVTLGAVILLVQLIRAIRGHFTATDQFGLEAGSWYWHFVDVVWICLFFLVYIV